MDENNINQNINNDDFQKDEISDTIQDARYVQNPYEESDFSKITDYKPLEYTPIESKKNVSSGIKIFTLFMAAVVTVTGSCLGGYLLGFHKYSKSSNEDYIVSLNLESKPLHNDELTAAQVYEKVN